MVQYRCLLINSEHEGAIIKVMKVYTCSEKDWKLFREKVPGWQESFMERLNREYIVN